MINTSAFIEGLTAYLNTVKEGFSVFYDRAPSKKAFPYGVISGVNESSLGEGYLTSFDLDLWTDDKLPTATEEIEELCDITRNALNNKVLSSAGVNKTFPPESPPSPSRHPRRYGSSGTSEDLNDTGFVSGTF